MQFGLYLLINKPKYILENSSSCIDLIYAKFKLNVHHRPPYELEVWDYKEEVTDLIWQSIEMFDWDRAFTNSNVNDTVEHVHKNILSNLIPHQTIAIDDEDPPLF